MIVYDTHESRTFVVRYLKKFEEIRVVSRALEIADYLVQTEGGTIAIERKRASDFLSSISDGRLFTQIEHLLEYEDARIILEGAIFTSSKSRRCYSIDALGKPLNVKRSAKTQPRTMWSTQFFVHPHALASIFKKIQDVGVRIIPTGSAYDTADLLKYWATKGESREYLAIRTKKKGLTDLDRQLFLLAGLGGISTKRAEALLKEFGSPMRVFTAFLEHSPKKFPVEGIGEKTAAQIKKLLTGNIVDVKPSKMIEHEFRECVAQLDNILNRAENELRKKTIPELKKILKKRNLELSGKKEELIRRILRDMDEREKTDIPAFLREYEKLLKTKTTFQKIPPRLEKKYRELKKVK
ncbi:MAG: ERCC4 domain-containing protein [Candidatus Hydrothermarchaeaceae archaeon]